MIGVAAGYTATMSDPSNRDLEEFYPDDDQVRSDSDENDTLHRPEVGRIVEPDSEVDELDKTAEPVASDVGGDGGDLSAEEQAMHIVEDR